MGDYVKWYEWAPAGFVHNYRWREGVECAFAPLYIADREYWHKDGDALSGRYPCHVPRNIGDVERAWKH